MKKERQVKSYQRRTKSGKMITVKAHSRKCESGACKVPGAGEEYRKHGKVADFMDGEGNFSALKEYAAQFMDVKSVKTKNDLKELFNKELSGDKTNHKKAFKKFKNEEFFPGIAYERRVKARNAKR